jgi:prolipoprotein diacylglyceryltransferase
VLFAWRGIEVWSYPACLFIGVNVGIVAQNVAAHAVGENALRVYVATLLLLPGALVGSRLLFLAGHWRYFVANPAALWRTKSGGMSMLGGVPLMVALSFPLLAALRVPVWRFWDLAIFCILPGMACTRVGCLLNGCCAGREAQHALTLKLPNSRGVWAHRYPTQILEGVVALILLGVAVAVYPAVARTHGVLFLLMTGAYGLARLGLQSLRDDRDWLGPFDLQHIMAAGMVALSTIGLVLIVG